MDKTLVRLIARTSFGAFSGCKMGLRFPSGLYLGAHIRVTLVFNGETIGPAKLTEMRRYARETNVYFDQLQLPLGIHARSVVNRYFPPRTDLGQVLQLYVNDLPIVTLAGCSWCANDTRDWVMATGRWVELDGLRTTWR